MNNFNKYDQISKQDIIIVYRKHNFTHCLHLIHFFLMSYLIISIIQYLLLILNLKIRQNLLME